MDIFWKKVFFYKEMVCQNGTRMNLNHFTRDGLMWQCPSSSCGCTPSHKSRQHKTIRSSSFFAGRNMPLNLVLQAL